MTCIPNDIQQSLRTGMIAEKSPSNQHAKIDKPSCPGTYQYFSLVSMEFQPSQQDIIHSWGDTWFLTSNLTSRSHMVSDFLISTPKNLRRPRSNTFSPCHLGAHGAPAEAPGHASHFAAPRSSRGRSARATGSSSGAEPRWAADPRTSPGRSPTSVANLEHNLVH